MQIGGSSYNGYKMLFNFTAKTTQLTHRVVPPVSGLIKLVSIIYYEEN